MIHPFIERVDQITARTVKRYAPGRVCSAMYMHPRRLCRRACMWVSVRMNKRARACVTRRLCTSGVGFASGRAMIIAASRATQRTHTRALTQTSSAREMDDDDDDPADQVSPPSSPQSSASARACTRRGEKPRTSTTTRAPHSLGSSSRSASSDQVGLRTHARDAHQSLTRRRAAWSRGRTRTFLRTAAYVLLARGLSLTHSLASHQR